MNQPQALATEIKRQIGPYGLMVVGAHKIYYTKDNGGTLVFKARLHYKGQTRVRICTVKVTLNALDYYDIAVVHADKWGEVKREATFTDVSADELTKFMYRLDKEGF